MRFTPGTPFVSVLVLLALTSEGGASPLFPSGSWGAFSRYARLFRGVQGMGIGGLQVDIDGQLPLKPADLRYAQGMLSVQFGQVEAHLEVSPIEVYTAVQVVQKHPATTRFQASLDRTRLGDHTYLDPHLPEPLSRMLLETDLAFSVLPQLGINYPASAPLHPLEQARHFLREDAEYRALAQKYDGPPLSWPQIYLRFNPAVPGLVKLEFRPQVLFRSTENDAIEPSPEEAELGERPYAALRAHIEQNPLEYRQAVPALNRIALLTALFGVVRAACRTPGTCQHLYAAAFGDPAEPRKVAAGEAKIAWDAKYLRYTARYGEGRIDQGPLVRDWGQLADKFADTPPNMGDSEWAVGYDLVRRGVALRQAHHVNQAQDLIRRAARQFLSFQPPEDAELLAAAAVVYARQGDQSKVAALLQRAEQLAQPYPGALYEVSILGDATAMFLADAGVTVEEARWTKVAQDARKRSHEMLERYISGCLTGSGMCSSDDLRSWEHDVERIRLDAFLSRSDLGFLYGRMAYLIGMMERSKTEAAEGRLRFLAAYADQVEEPGRSTQLRQYEFALAKAIADVAQPPSDPVLVVDPAAVTAPVPKRWQAPSEVLAKSVVGVAVLLLLVCVALGIRWIVRQPAGWFVLIGQLVIVFLYGSITFLLGLAWVLWRLKDNRSQERSPYQRRPHWGLFLRQRTARWWTTSMRSLRGIYRNLRKRVSRGRSRPNVRSDHWN